MKKINKFLLGLIGFLCLYTSTTRAQDQQGGLIFKEERYSSQPTMPELLTANKDEKLPKSISLKQWTPKVQSQGVIGSGVGWAVGYAAMTIMYAQANNWTDLNQRTEEAFSALYIYNHIKVGRCNTGAYLADAGKFLMSSGNCKSVDFDYIEDNCEKEAAPDLQKTAKQHKIKSYFRVFNYSDKGKTKIRKVKKNLAEGYPVVIGMQLRKNFFYPTAEYWQPDEGETAISEKHAMTIIGYDDDRQAFELMNSWGTDWGNEGFIWVKYEDFAKYVLGAYRYVINEPKPIVKKAVHYRGAFDFRYPIFDGDEIYDFKSVQPTKSENYHYALQKKNWEIGDMYQLVVTETQVNRAIYVFSLDVEGANIHWPRDARLNSQFDTLDHPETSLIPFKKVQIVIPGENDALTKRISGPDHILILYAYGEIKDFKKRVLKTQNATGTVTERFQVGFGDMVVPLADINYTKDTMKFTSSTKSDKYIVPILITVEGE